MAQTRTQRNIFAMLYVNKKLQYGKYKAECVLR